MKTITTTIKREFLAAIIAGTKKIEYREIKPYWQERIGMTLCPFRMRLINGMSKNAPEVTVLIENVTLGRSANEPELHEPGFHYRCHIAKVLNYKNWNKRKGIPAWA